MKKQPFLRETVASISLDKVLRFADDGDRTSPVLNTLAPPQEYELAMKIVLRAEAEAAADGRRVDRRTALNDIMAVHLNGRPLKLLSFLMADTPRFAHDFVLINRTIDRKTGKLMLPESKKLFCEEKA